MTTSELIQAMTDPGQFELLACRVLRQTQPECIWLQHLGVNESNQTIKAPIDGYALIPGSNPPTFVMACYSIGKTLKDKWFLDTSQTPRKGKGKADDGDLVKAAREAGPIQKANSLARIKVFVCTNQQPEKELVDAAIQLGATNGMDVHLLTRSLIRDHLDTTPQGQYLRKLHLGVDEELLSEELLRDIGRESLSEYEALILRPIDSQVAAQDEQAMRLARAFRLTFVVAPSGFGKSTLCALALCRYCESGGSVLHVPGPIASDAASLAEAVERTLRARRPKLAAGCGAHALSLSSRMPLLIAVDDVNKTGQPIDTARKLVSWAHLGSEKQGEQAVKYRLIAPLWDSVASRFTELHPDLPLPEGVGVLRPAPWTLTDGVGFVQRGLDPLDDRNKESKVRTAVEACGRDPVLLALLITVARVNQDAELVELANNVLGIYIDAELHRASTIRFTPGNLLSALTKLAATMLKLRQLSLRLSTLLETAPSLVEALPLLLEANAICRTAGTPSNEAIEFKHDRLFERFAILALTQLCADFDQNEDVLLDPYYASISAQAMLDANLQLPIAILISRAPILVAELLRFLPLSDTRSELVAQALREWISNVAERGSALECEQWLVSRVLFVMNSHLVLDVTRDRPPDRMFRRAKFANGDFNAGLEELGGDHGFEPSLRDSQRDEALARATENHRSTMLKGCSSVLQAPKPSERDLKAVFAICGFLQDADLTAQISSAWERSQWKEDLLELALWACLRCGGPHLAHSIEPLLSFWEQLPEDVFDGQGHRSPRNSVGGEVGRLMELGLPIPSIEVLTQAGTLREGLRFPIALLFERLYVPQAVRFVIEEAARSIEWCRKNKGVAFWSWDLPRHWKGDLGYQPMPLAIQDEIRSMGSDASLDPIVTRTAREFWVDLTDDLDALRSIVETDDAFSTAVWRRVCLGDISAIPAARLMFRERHSYWQLVSQAPCAEIESDCDAALAELAERTPSDFSGGQTDNYYYLACFLRAIEVPRAEALLKKHWHGLRNSRYFLQLAIYLGSATLLKLAHERVSTLDEPQMAFDHLSMIFGFSYEDLDSLLGRHHIECLSRFLMHLPSNSLRDVARVAQRLRMSPWLGNVLSPEIQRRLSGPNIAEAERKSLDWANWETPTDADLVRSLDETLAIGRRREAAPYIWAEQFKVRCDSQDRMSAVLLQWLRENQCVERFRVVTEIITERGRRRDLEMLREEAASIDDIQKAADLLKRATVAVTRRTLVY